MAFEITTNEARQYQVDGFFVRESAFTAAEVAELRGAAEHTAEAAAAGSGAGRAYLLDGNRFVDFDHVTVQFEHSPGSDTVRVVEPAHPFDTRWEALIDDARIVAPMRGLIGSERVALWTDKLNLKRPREGSGFGWHQDSPYWMHDCGHVDLLPNVFLALDAASEANGCIRIIRGSHLEGCLPGISNGSQLGGFFTDPQRFDVSRQALLEVPAGSLVFFNPHAVHGSLPNRSDQPRRAIILTYQPGDNPMLKSGRVRNAGKAGESGAAASGEHHES
ncbi:MAG: phytanoyl-CoA dioxygenase family protein [Pseudomonadales bacterium]